MVLPKPISIWEIIKKSLSNARQAADIAGEANDKKTESESLDLISVIHEERGEFRQSLAAQRQAQAVRIEIFEQEQASKNTEMRVRFDHLESVSSLEMQKAKTGYGLSPTRGGITAKQSGPKYPDRDIRIGFYSFLLLLIRGLRNNKRKNQLLEEKGGEIKEKNIELKRIQNELQQTNARLEELVDERTDALKEAVNSLIEVNEDLDTFIYRASHDLLGPIARLKGLSILLRNSQDSDPGTYVDLIDSVAVYMDRVLRKLILVHDMRQPKEENGQSSIPEIIREIEPGLLEIPGIVSPTVHVDCQINDDVPFPTKLVRVALEKYYGKCLYFP